MNATSDFTNPLSKLNDDRVNDEDCNEELYREILVSSQNRYSHPDYNGNGGQLDTSQNQQFH